MVPSSLLVQGLLVIGCTDVREWGVGVRQTDHQPNHLPPHTDIWTACQLQFLI